MIDDMDNNLGKTFKTYDKYDASTKTATSVKTVNLEAKSYQSGNTLYNNMKKAVDDVIDFEFYTQNNFTLDNTIIDTKVVEYKISNIELNQSQIQNIQRVIDYANINGVKIEITIIK
jgi:hypothetical protein